ncbi:hypothetical protein [Burkholderia lata]|uniref:hypothetical protein n=1 Tax=Burkholderia lata (strain ATCC 17760 / DSM 23089 / LMG 22485 / NCIMB 9086 / R18194 / 383) TaxID=482957 RepID=UPI00399B5619
MRNTRLCCALLRAFQSVSERGLAEGCHPNKTLSNAMQCGLPIRDARQDRNFYLKNAWRIGVPQADAVGVEKPWIDAGLDWAAKQLALRAPRQLRPRVFGTLKKRIAAASGYRILSIGGADTFEIGHHGRERRHRNRRDIRSTLQRSGDRASRTRRSAPSGSDRFAAHFTYERRARRSSKSKCDEPDSRTGRESPSVRKDRYGNQVSATTGNMPAETAGGDSPITTRSCTTTVMSPRRCP